MMSCRKPWQPIYKAVFLIKHLPVLSVSLNYSTNDKVHLLPVSCNDYELDARQSTAPPLTSFGDGWSISFKDTVRAH